MTSKDPHELEGKHPVMAPLQDAGPLDLQILRMLTGDGQATLAFQGLRKRMGIHQEKLSRALRRLEEDGLVQKTPHGYTITPRGSLLAQEWLPSNGGTFTPLLEARLPGDVSPEQVAVKVRGRWFGNLRWLGTVEAPGRTVLRWITESKGAEVRLVVEWGRINIDTDADEGPELSEAFEAAQILFSHLGPLRGTRDGVAHLMIST
jgi:DNA-binding MarR family transcriptional regulator